MKIVLERHAFAPELNKAHIYHRGKRIALLPAKSACTIKQARAALFAPVTPCIVATVTKEYQAPYEYLNRTWRGVVKTRAEATSFMRVQQTLNPGGKRLVNGDWLPVARYSTVTKLSACPSVVTKLSAYHG